MKGINIELTKWQTEMLKPLFDEIKTAFDKEKPCAIIAQVWGNVDMAKPSFMVVRVIDSDICNALQAATGVKKDKIGVDTVTVLQPEG